MSDITGESLKNWVEKINRDLGIGDPDAPHNKWERTSDAREIVRRAIVIRDSGNSTIATDEGAKLHIAYAESRRADLEAAAKEEATDG
jgi:hypothetical protein